MRPEIIDELLEEAIVIRGSDAWRESETRQQASRRVRILERAAHIIEKLWIEREAASMLSKKGHVNIQTSTYIRWLDSVLADSIGYREL